MAATVTKNWLPLVLGPALAMESEAALGVFQGGVELVIGELIAGSACSCA